MLLPYLGLAQDFKEIRGQVVHDSLSVAGIHVINRVSGAATITREDGQFAIVAQANDVLVFSAIQFKTHAIVLDAVLFQQDFIKVYVEAFVNELDEVVVKPHDLSGNLKEDIAKVEKPINFDDVGIPGFKGKPQERIPKTGHLVLSSMLGSVPIEEVIKKINGYYKELKLRRKMDTENEMVVQMIEYYGVAFFMNNYELHLDEVYPFVLGAVIATDIEADFKAKHHNLVLATLSSRR